jgi:hypothetical protein
VTYPQQPYQPPQQPYQPPQQQQYQPPAYTGPGAPPPAPEGSRAIKLSQHVGDLVWLRATRYDPDFVGQYGAKPAIIIDIEVLQGRSEVGERFVGSLHTNWKLVSQLQGHLNQDYFGRLAGEQGAGANPAVYLGNPLPGDEQWINAFLARRAGSQAQQPPQQQAPAQQPYAVPQSNAPQPAQPAPPAYSQQQQTPYQQPYAPPPAQPQQNGQPPGYQQPQQQPAQQGYTQDPPF